MNKNIDLDFLVTAITDCATLESCLFAVAATEWATAEDAFYVRGIAIRAEFEHWSAEEVSKALDRTHRTDLSEAFQYEGNGYWVIG